MKNQRSGIGAIFQQRVKHPKIHVFNVGGFKVSCRHASHDTRPTGFGFIQTTTTVQTCRVRRSLRNVKIVRSSQTRLVGDVKGGQGETTNLQALRPNCFIRKHFSLQHGRDIYIVSVSTFFPHELVNPIPVQRSSINARQYRRINRFLPQRVPLGNTRQSPRVGLGSQRKRAAAAFKIINEY